MQLLQCTTTPPGGGGQWNSCNAWAHQLGGRGVLPRRRSLPKEQYSYNALPHCLGAVGSATSAMHCLTAWGQWAVELLSSTTTLPRGSGQCNSCNALPHCLGAVGSATPAIHCLTALGPWAVELLQCTATLSGGGGQWNSCNAWAHQLGGDSCPGGGRCLKSGTPAMHCHTAWGQWVVQLLQCTATLPGGIGQCNSCNALPHCSGAVGSTTSVVWCGVVRAGWGRAGRGRAVLCGVGRCGVVWRGVV